ncbi:MAG: Arm DNA-binding domain-containing protein [Candidatus Binataceae bacterium]
MASLLRGRKGYLVLQFYYQRQLCREYLGLQDTRDNRRDQKEFLKKLEAALRIGTFEYPQFFPESTNAHKFQPAPARSTLLDYFNSYLETLEISEATRYDLECLRREYIERTGLGAKLLNEITPAQIRAVLKQAKDEGKHRRPVVFLQRLRSMYDAAIEDEIVDKNPARRIKNP